MEDTIAAISTALGVAAISIIRVSGKDSINIVSKIYRGKNLKKQQSHTINYGKIIDENGNMVDEVLVMLMRAPKTFTREDVIEINCHGGIATTNKILELLLQSGCRIAEPGEFTKRAFLNGRIDLTEAEGVMDLIQSKTNSSMYMAIRQLRGCVSTMISNLRKEILEVLANIEVNIDYPEYDDIEQLTCEKLSIKIDSLHKKMEQILNESKAGKIIKDGINVAIVGRPNVGKSSLLNILIEEEKAIVTSIEGTTRDIVEGKVDIGGIILNIIDTAGIRKTNDEIEKIGVDKSLDIIKKSDLILFVLDNNRKISEEEIDIFKLIEKQKHLILLNKIDLCTKINLADLVNIDEEKIIRISTIKKEGIDRLKNEIKRMFFNSEIDEKNLTYLTSARSISLLKKSMLSLDNAEESLKNNIPIDMVEIDLKEAWTYLGEIIGETYEEELIDQLFSQFCLGK